MKKFGKKMLITGFAGLFTLLSISIQADIAKGKEIAFSRKKGNCLACHNIAGGDLPGNLGTPLFQMKARYPDRELLRKIIWNRPAFNPNTAMPPFGKHGILTEEEIDHVVDFIHSL